MFTRVAGTTTRIPSWPAVNQFLAPSTIAGLPEDSITLPEISKQFFCSGSHGFGDFANLPVGYV